MLRLQPVITVLIVLAGAALAPSMASAASGPRHAVSAASDTAPYGTFPKCTNGGQGYETQVWWQPMAGAPMPDESGHDHLGACLPPLYSRLSEPLRIDAVVQLHNNPSTLVGVRWSDGSTIKQKVKSNFSCATEQCTVVVPLTIDPALFDRSGYRELRLTADTKTADKQRMYNTTRWCYLIASPKAPANYCPAPGSAKERTGAAGWYTGLEYMNLWTRWDDIQPTVKSGLWTVRVKFDPPTRKKGTSFSGAFATVDPRFHATPVDPGMVVPVQQTTAWQTITIDTTRLSNGPHRLFIQTQAHGTKPLGDGSGVMTLPFTVHNAPPADPPPTDPPPSDPPPTDPPPSDPPPMGMPAALPPGGAVVA